jgi:hypothetical protein
VRQEHVDFLEDWLQCRPETGKILLGSPGIGKSVCSYLVVEYMLRQPDTVVKWLWDGQNTLRGCMAWADDIYLYNFADMQLQHQLPRASQCAIKQYHEQMEARTQCVLVYDGIKNMHYLDDTGGYSKGLVVHSPSAESIAGTEKEGFRRWYMKPWNDEEVQTYARKRGYDGEVALELFKLLGGAVRDILEGLAFGTDEEKYGFAREHIEEGIDELYPGERNQTATQGLEGKRPVHRVLHYYPQPERRGLKEIYFSTHYALSRYLEKRGRTSVIAMIQQPSLGCELEAGVHGYIERNQSCSFSVRKLEGTHDGTPFSETLRYDKGQFWKYSVAGDLVSDDLGKRLRFFSAPSHTLLSGPLRNDLSAWHVPFAGVCAVGNLLSAKEEERGGH